MDFAFGALLLGIRMIELETRPVIRYKSAVRKPEAVGPLPGLFNLHGQEGKLQMRVSACGNSHFSYLTARFYFRGHGQAHADALLTFLRNFGIVVGNYQVFGLGKMNQLPGNLLI